MDEYVVLVNEQDEEMGVREKRQAHVEGVLHRAFSVFLFDEEGALLLQQRHPDKYHSGGLWSNTCCSHPRPGEPVAAAAHRRLREEMGITCGLHRAFGFVYRSALDHGLYEHEYDHVFVGYYRGTPSPDPTEVVAWRWAEADALRREILERPDQYTYWFRFIVDRVLTTFEQYAR